MEKFKEWLRLSELAIIKKTQPKVNTKEFDREDIGMKKPINQKEKKNETYQWEPIGEIKQAIRSDIGPKFLNQLNDEDRSQWIDNDESLYDWFKSSKLSKKDFIKENKEEIDKAIKKAS